MHSELNLLESWGWRDQSSSPPIAAYIHIPFCRHRCGYCNFSLLANRDDLFERFLDGLAIELGELQEPRPVDTLFLGGGTPSILPAPLMRKLLALLRHWLPFSKEWRVVHRSQSARHPSRLTSILEGSRDQPYQYRGPILPPNKTEATRARSLSRRTQACDRRGPIGNGLRIARPDLCRPR